MQETQLHKRLALLVLSIVGNKTRNIVIGAILVSILLAFFVPSATARAGYSCTNLIRYDCRIQSIKRK